MDITPDKSLFFTVTQKACSILKNCIQCHSFHQQMFYKRHIVYIFRCGWLFR
jgi:hypothetical protein